MRMVAHYSHLNGLEYLLVHKSGLWKEIEEVISSVDAEQCRIKVSGEKRMMGKMLYSPRAMNKAVKRGFEIGSGSNQRQAIGSRRTPDSSAGP